MKYILLFLLLLTGCTNNPSDEQKAAVNAYIQEQLDAVTKNLDFSQGYQGSLLKGETVEQAIRRTKKTMTNIHTSLTELKEKPFSEQRPIIVRQLKAEIDLFDKTLARHFELRPTEPPTYLIAILEQRRKWLNVLD